MTTRVGIAKFQAMLERTPLSDGEIADAAGVSSSTVYRWRKGQATPAIGHVRDVTHVIESRARDDVKRAKLVWRALGEINRVRGLDNGDREGYA